MQRLTQEEAASLTYKTPAGAGVSKNDHIYKEINLLTTGEAIKVEKSEWNGKSMPSNASFPKKVRSLDRTYRVRSLADNSAWVITRIS